MPAGPRPDNERENLEDFELHSKTPPEAEKDQPEDDDVEAHLPAGPRPAGPRPAGP